MIRLLIVEDEAPIRNGLLRHVPWKTLGVDEVSAAENAEDALRTAAELRPDIVLSDIRMPGMLGTDMARALRGLLPDCQILFVSGYSDKEYLHAAISLSAVGYVEKPISVEELSDVVCKAVSAVQKTRRERQTTLHSLLNGSGQEELLTADGDNGSGAWRNYVMFMIRTDGSAIPGIHDIAQDVLNNLRQEMLERFGGESLALADMVSANSYALLIALDSPWDRELVELTSEAILSYRGEGSRWFVSASREHHARGNVREAWREALAGVRHLSYKGWNCRADAMDSSEEYRGTVPEDRLRAFYQLVRERRQEEAEAYVESWCRFLTDMHAVMNFRVRNVFDTLSRAAMRTMENAEPPEEEADEERLEELCTIRELGDWVNRQLREIMNCEENGTGNYLVREVCEYIEAHLGDSSLSLGRLAEVVYLTPTYLSAMFRRNRGITVGQFIADARIGRACELLADPQYKLYQVAGLVGYEDPKYFTKLFKKKVGLTPTEYRESL
ncbi:response regulator [Lachnoclostridium sp. Marseille-P6806]|uniref:response regulator n=1 Tax=Lachnoclostridium sp. Marseille-P6806 TaxID=2364793 RepID=UPI00102FEE7A|nr:response regulator [Lachnoclostridium sp. Marseille-P6806]